MGFSVVLDGSRSEWFVDATRNGRSQTVAWRPGRGFGFSTAPEAVYGSKPDEIVEGVENALACFGELTQTPSATGAGAQPMP